MAFTVPFAYVSATAANVLSISGLCKSVKTLKCPMFVCSLRNASKDSRVQGRRQLSHVADGLQFMNASLEKGVSGRHSRHPRQGE